MFITFSKPTARAGSLTDNMGHLLHLMEILRLPTIYSVCHEPNQGSHIRAMVLLESGMAVK